MIRLFNQLVSLKTIVLIQAEALLILFCFFAAARVWFWDNPSELAAHTAMPFFFFQCLFQIALLQSCFYYNGLYTVLHASSRTLQLVRLMRAMGIWWLISAALNFLVPAFAFGRGVSGLALLFTLAGVFIARLVSDRAWQAAPKRNLIVLGTGPIAMAVAQEIRRRSDLNLNILAFAAKESPSIAVEKEFLGRPVMRMDKLMESAPRQLVSQIVVALQQGEDLPIADLTRLRLSGVRVETAQEVLTALSGRVPLDPIFCTEVILGVGFRLSTFTLVWKRALDLFFGTLGLLVTAPVMGIAALAIWLESGPPILYRQTRVGICGKEFQLLKFRSMRVDAEANGEAKWAVLNDPRVTRVGAFLRSYKIDEFPQFLNVVRGQMSLIGPRPERPCFVAQLRSQISCYDERHSVRPGVTGWAQVLYPYGRTTTDAVRKLEYDLFYLKNMSFPFDCAIALKTLRIILLGSGNR